MRRVQFALTPLLASVLGLGFGTAVLAVASPSAPSIAAGELRCVGASTMQPLVAAWAQAFVAHRPGAVIEVPGGTHYSAAGVEALVAGRANCITFAREPFATEQAALRKATGQAAVIVPVAGGSHATPHGTFALAIYVNRRNPLRGLSVTQLAAVFAQGAPSPTRWGQLGLRGAWMQRPIHVYGMTPRRASGNPPGIVNFLDRKLLRGRPWRRDMRIQKDANGVSALAAIVRQVGADPDGIGYSGFAYATAAVRSVPLSTGAGEPFHAGTPAGVAAGRYVLGRTIYLGFPASVGGGLSSAACRFLSFILGADGQQLIARDSMHFNSLTPAQVRAARATLVDRGHCASTDAPPPRPAYVEADGAIRIVGYNDMRWMLEALDRTFARSHPGIRFDLVLKGTRTAPAALADGSSLFAPMGAEFTEQALRQYRQRVGAAPLLLRVAHAALDPRARSSPLAIYVNPANPLSAISMRQLRAIFASSARLTMGAQLGLGGSWAHWRIHPCGLAADTALGVFMRRHHFGGAPYVDTYRGFRESSAVLQQVATDPEALCFADLNQASQAVRVVGIRLPASAGVSRGSRQDIFSGRYPLDRHLYAYLRAPAAGGADPLACAYLSLMLSARGQRIIAASAPGYLPLNDAEQASERHRLRLAGCDRDRPAVQPASSL
jgi:phosphate transport system substrate-binding protein